MKVLQLCNKPPFPPADGGALAMQAVTDGLLAAGAKVRMLCIATDKHPFDEEKIPAAWKNSVQPEAVYVDTRVKPLPALANLFSSSSYNIERFRSAAFEKKLEQLLRRETFDIVHLESLYMTPFLPCIRRFSEAAVVLRAHNVEHRLWERLATHESQPKKSYFRLLASRLARYENETAVLADAIVTITQEDAGYFRSLPDAPPVHVLPFAMPLPEPAEGKPETGTVFHLGSMDWKPNEEGVRWLIGSVWPLVLKAIPGARLHLAGRSMPDAFRLLDTPGIEVHGEVADAREFLSRYAVMTVPLLSGGGMRVKLVEGMASGKAIVTTSVGREGVDAENGKQLLVADDAAAFAAAITRLLRDHTLAVQLGEAARLFAGNFFDRATATAKLLDFYSEIIRKKKTR